MKRTVSLITAGLAVAALTFGGASLASADTTTPDADEKSALAFSREEEKMAHDLYTAFGDKYDSAVWDRIANSEQRHFDAIGRLLDQFDVADPSEDNKAGVYDNGDVQALYDRWLAQGEKSEADAFKAAIELEERDIADLKVQIEATDNDDIDAVYERLLAGSENHLAAFTAWANGEPVTGLQQGQGMQQGQQNEARRAQRSAVCDGTGMDDTDRGNADALRDGSGDRLLDGSGNEDAPRRGMNRGNA
ncbi:MAG TPA: DUF2202 domain-containing protein [Arachnia sp.]|nr:DUF2202 domain-containing protein [Arachnia sp.]